MLNSLIDIFRFSLQREQVKLINAITRKDDEDVILLLSARPELVNKPLISIFKQTRLCPIHFAAVSGNLNATNFLLSKGADPSVITPMSQMTPKDLAEESGHHVLSKRLAQAVAEKSTCVP